MKKSVFFLPLVLLFFSCAEQSRELVLDGQYEDTATIKYILSDDLNDKIIGYSPNALDLFDPVYTQLKERGFEPNRVVYYSNDTKHVDTKIYYEDENIISYQRFSYRSIDRANQHSIDFK